MIRVVKYFLLLLVLNLFQSCENEPDCKWCVTYEIEPCFEITGQGYACGETLEIVNRRRLEWIDHETGVNHVIVTFCDL